MLVSSGMHVILLTVHSIVLGLGYNPHDKKLDNAFPNPQDDREMLITGEGVLIYSSFQFLQ